MVELQRGMGKPRERGRQTALEGKPAGTERGFEGEPETHGRTRALHSWQREAERPRLVGGAKPWSRWLRRGWTSPGLGLVVSTPGELPSRPTLGSEPGRGPTEPRARERFGASGHAWSQKAPRLEHFGERARKRQSRRSGHLGGHSSGAEPSRSRQGEATSGSNPVKRPVSGSSKKEDASTRSRVEATPGQELATTRARCRRRHCGADQGRCVARHARPEEGTSPGRGETRSQGEAEAWQAIREGHPPACGSERPEGASPEVTSSQGPEVEGVSPRPEVTSRQRRGYPELEQSRACTSRRARARGSARPSRATLRGSEVRSGARSGGAP